MIKLPDLSLPGAAKWQSVCLNAVIHVKECPGIQQ